MVLPLLPANNIFDAEPGVAGCSNPGIKNEKAVPAQRYRRCWSLRYWTRGSIAFRGTRGVPLLPYRRRSPRFGRPAGGRGGGGAALCWSLAGSDWCPLTRWAALPALIACRIGLTTPFAFAVALPPIKRLRGALFPFVVFGVFRGASCGLRGGFAAVRRARGGVLATTRGGGRIAVRGRVGAGVAVPAAAAASSNWSSQVRFVAGAELVPLVGGPAPAEGAAAGHGLRRA